MARTRCFSSVRRGSLHLDFHAHPRMDAALKKMFPFRQARYLELAALQDSRFGDREIFKPTGTFWCYGLSSIEVFDKAATKVRNLGETGDVNHKANLIESFMGMGMTEEQAKVAAAGRAH